MSPDLKIATAFVSPLGAKDADAVIEALNKHAKFMRGRVSSALRQMKYMPEFRFRLDTSFDNFAEDQRSAALAGSGARSRIERSKTTRMTNSGASRQEEGPAGFRLGGAGQAGRHGLDRGRLQGQMAVPGRKGRPCRHARPAGVGHAADRARRGDQDRALCAGRRQDLSLHRRLGRGALDRRSRRAGDEDLRHARPTQARSRGAAAEIHRRHHADAAAVLGDQDRRRARL